MYAALGRTADAAKQQALARAAGARPGQRVPFPSAIDARIYLEVK